MRCGSIYKNASGLLKGTLSQCLWSRCATRCGGLSASATRNELRRETFSLRRWLVVGSLLPQLLLTQQLLLLGGAVVVLEQGNLGLRTRTRSRSTPSFSSPAVKLLAGRRRKK